MYLAPRGFTQLIDRLRERPTRYGRLSRQRVNNREQFGADAIRR
jgi:hypothetical protein